MNRRDAMTTLVASAALMPCKAAFASDWGEFSERQRGDPALPAETIRLDAEKIQARMTGLASYRERLPDDKLAKSLVSAAQPMIGWSRAATPERIAEVLDVYSLPFKDKDGAFVPFCAAGVSYLAATAYLTAWGVPSTTNSIRGALLEIDHYHFYPSPSVLDMYYVAQGKRRWVDAKPGMLTPKAGWLVIYDWSGRRSGADHVGLVTGFDAQGLHTIEFNTSRQDQKNGGQVAERTRQYDKFVRGFVRTELHTPI